LKHLIVGVDPGHTIGIAALDFEGNICNASNTSGGIESAVSIIESWGTPSIIACDVTPAPEFVLKLASYFNVKLFVPKKTWREDDKREMLKQAEEKAGKRLAQNTHERDALSAAIGAYRESQNQLRSIFSMQIDSDKKQKVCHLILQGYRRDTALLMTEPKENIKADDSLSEMQSRNSSPLSVKKHLLSIQAQLMEFERKNIELSRRIIFLEQENSSLRQKSNSLQSGSWARMQKEKEIFRLRSQNASLQRRLTRANSFLFSVSKQLGAIKKSSVQKNNAPKKEEKSDEKKHANADEKKHANAQKNSQSDFSSSEKAQNTAKSLKGLDPLDNLRRLVENYRNGRLE